MTRGSLLRSFVFCLGDILILSCKGTVFIGSVEESPRHLPLDAPIEWGQTGDLEKEQEKDGLAHEEVLDSTHEEKGHYLEQSKSALGKRANKTHCGSHRRPTVGRKDDPQ